MAKVVRVFLDYGRSTRRSAPRGLIAVLVAVVVFGARVGWLRIHRAVTVVPATAVVLTPLPAAGVDMQMINSLDHGSEGQNVLYAAGHMVPTTMPYAGETRDQNSSRWLDNIYTVQTEHFLSTRGVLSNLPFDDRDTIMLPTSDHE
jgi:hypothetical protein